MGSCKKLKKQMSWDVLFSQSAKGRELSCVEEKPVKLKLQSEVRLSENAEHSSVKHIS